MEDRYEIRGKIGQGGLGSVYRGYDTRMNREVAIKRIANPGGDPELLEESTRQLIKEAGALASLQHPHIVTIYDVGSDEDGPYVVMELIAGKTLDELIERAPLTWADFREMALQTQEALIAAQELNLIHSDLKPSNLMLTWLPSGKFQVKIVDFGLATLSQSQNQQDLDTMEAVFGSVFFMPPEQFERNPLDARSDIYSMGCVYYQALAGIYPFDGTTGNEVMSAHLQHTVKPLKEVRAGIPEWACDWIMWQINRFPQDRPESSRDALSVFLKNDRTPNPTMSTGVPKPPPGPPRPRMLVPGAPNKTAQPLANPAQALQAPVVVDNKGGTITQTAPQPLAPPEGFKPSVHTAPQELPAESPAPPVGTQTTRRPGTQTQRAATPTTKASTATQGRQAAHRPVEPPHKMSKQAKIISMVAAAVLVAIAAFLVFKLIGMYRDKQVVKLAVAHVESGNTGKFKVASDSLQVLLESTLLDTADASTIGKALAVAEATDGTDIDSRIADFATKRPEVPTPVREMLIGEVLSARKNPVVLPAVMDLATTSNQPGLIVSALQAARPMAGEEYFAPTLKLLETSTDNQVRVAAELNIEEILRKARKPADFVKPLETSRDSTIKPDVSKALQRLIRVANTASPK